MLEVGDIRDSADYDHEAAQGVIECEALRKFLIECDDSSPVKVAAKLQGEATEDCAATNMIVGRHVITELYYKDFTITYGDYQWFCDHDYSGLSFMDVDAMSALQTIDSMHRDNLV